ncbi:MAG: response regulator transcription factor [Actinobacteria bacterium]|nr:response regulator transcription factor [Actinomycetota bacterium]
MVVAEDDVRQAELIRLYLERDGHQVVVTHDGRAALDEIRRRVPDLAVLDVMMPHVDGLDVCRILRYESDLPIIFVTARSTEEDLLLALDLGADDYLTKPYSPRELAARVRTVLRRARPLRSASEMLGVGSLEIDPLKHRVTLDNAVIAVTAKEFAVLAALAAEPGRAFSRQQLLEAAFGFDHDVLERTIDVHILNLRKKLEADAGDPQYICTVYGVGYAFAED